jgi:KinB signaling pathway activation protein
MKVGTITCKLSLGGERSLTIRKWFWLFCSTIIWGVLSTLIAGIILISTDNEFTFFEVTKVGFDLQTFTFIILGGATISVLSQMGFFSYLIIRYIAIGIIKNKRIWEIMQLILIAVAAFDLTYLRYKNFAKPQESWLGFLVLPILLLVISLIVSYWKMKLTKSSAFIPTLLFMFVITLLESVQVLRLNSPPSYFFMLTPLLVCNAWQILQLHRIIRTA